MSLFIKWFLTLLALAMMLAGEGDKAEEVYAALSEDINRADATDDQKMAARDRIDGNITHHKLR